MGFFKAPKYTPPPPPAPPPPPPPAPVVENTVEDTAAAKEEDRAVRRTQRGRAATLLTSGQGVLGDDSSGVATKKLLGK